MQWRRPREPQLPPISSRSLQIGSEPSCAPSRLSHPHPPPQPPLVGGGHWPWCPGRSRGVLCGARWPSAVPIHVLRESAAATATAAAAAAALAPPSATIDLTRPGTPACPAPDPCHRPLPSSASLSPSPCRLAPSRGPFHGPPVQSRGVQPPRPAGGRLYSVGGEEGAPPSLPSSPVPRRTTVPFQTGLCTAFDGLGLGKGGAARSRRPGQVSEFSLPAPHPTPPCLPPPRHPPHPTLPGSAPPDPGGVSSRSSPPREPAIEGCCFQRDPRPRSSAWFCQSKLA